MATAAKNSYIVEILDGKIIDGEILIRTINSP